MTVTKDTRFTIKLYDGADSITLFAASELEKYLIKAGLIKSDDSEIKFIFRKDESLGKEGMSISFENDSVLIAGEGAGVLYAVYELFERYFGFCFGAYNEAVTPKDSYVLEGGYTKTKADLEYRTAVLQFGVWAGETDRFLTRPIIDWLAKNRYNRILTWVSVYQQLKDMGIIPELEKRGISLTVGHHQAIYTFLPPYGNRYFDKKYYETNPEYYKLLEDGTRYMPDTFGGQLVLCCHNEEAIAEFAKNAVIWLKDNPQVDCIALWPNDFSELHCQCDKCKDFSKIENYIYFENEVIKLIKKELPYVKVDMLIYSDLWDCPENTDMLDDCVMIDQATWSGAGLRSIGKKDGSCMIGTDYANNLLKYKKICKNAVVYDYYMGNYNARQRIIPATQEMQSIFKFYVKEGILGSGTQFECFNLWNNAINFFAFARMQYDTDITAFENLKLFSKLFGKGAEYVKEIITDLEELCDGSESIRNMGISIINRADKDKIYKLFEKAIGAETENKHLRNNIRLLYLAFRYSHLITEDKTDDPSREPDTVMYLDPTGELAYMGCELDCYHNKQGKYGIAMPVTNKSDKIPDSIFYHFE